MRDYILTSMNMKRAGRLLGCVLLAGSGLASALSQDASNPYSVISERNVFHLNPPPPPPEPEKPKVDLPVIKLSGFFKVGAKTRALFSSVSKNKEEGWIYYNLAEGEKDGILEVVKIDEAEGKVDILNSGTRATLTLKEDSLTPAMAASAAASPGAGPGPPSPGMPPRRPFAPGGPAMARGAPGANGGLSPMRQRRTPVPQ
jgi:hypothetical protein